LPDLSNVSPIQFYSCFISHSSKDQLFTELLHADLHNQGVHCYYASENLKGGERLYPQTDLAIRVYEKLLVVLSEHSMNSEWVKTEIRQCRKDERRENRRKLFPIRLVDMETIKSWDFFDSDSGEDLAVSIRENFIPDFSNWEDRNSYKKALNRLLEDLKASVEHEDPSS
jgi:hypothetical protein